MVTDDSESPNDRAVAFPTTGAGAVSAPLSFTLRNTGTAAVPRRPSIIVIQAHDLALGDLSCYGQTNYQTPNLDRLAREGMRFTNYSGGTASQQTTAMLLAGRAGAVFVRGLGRVSALRARAGKVQTGQVVGAAEAAAAGRCGHSEDHR